MPKRKVVTMNIEAFNKEIKHKEAETFREKHEEVKRWIRKAESQISKKKYTKAIMRYCACVEKTPKQLIQLKQNSKNHDAEDLLDEFVEFTQQNGITDNVIWNIVVAIKSFYKWNYADLSKGAGKITRTKVKPYRTPDKDSLRKFLEGAQIRDKAIISFMASTGIALGSIPKLTWNHVQDIENDVPHVALTSVEIKGKGKGKYEGIEQHTFLTPHAKESLLAYKEWRQRKEKRKLKPNDPLFTINEKPYTALNEISVRKVFDRRSEESGIKFSAHDMRRFTQTQLETARLQPNWIKKVLRHKISGEENPYSQPKIEALREAFKTALPYLDLSEKLKLNELELRKRMKLDQLKTEVDPDTFAQIERLVLQAKNIEEYEDVLGKIRTIRGIEPLRRAEQREDCQKIITESQLEQWLTKGYHYIATLPSGKIVIDNNR